MGAKSSMTNPLPIQYEVSALPSGLGICTTIGVSTLVKGGLKCVTNPLAWRSYTHVVFGLEAMFSLGFDSLIKSVKPIGSKELAALIFHLL